MTGRMQVVVCGLIGFVASGCKEAVGQAKDLNSINHIVVILGPRGAGSGDRDLSVCQDRVRRPQDL